MNDVARKVAEAAQHMEAPLETRRIDALALGIAERARRRRRMRRVRAGIGVGVLAACVVVVGIAGRGTRTIEMRAVSPEVRAERAAYTFGDGSEAFLAPGGRFGAVVERDDGIAIALEAGGARFAVTPGRRTPFRVEAGPVLVEVMGTRFEVVRLEAQARVTVETGKVRVRWEGGETMLGAGDAGLYPPPPPETEPTDHDHEAAVGPSEAPSASSSRVRQESERRNASMPGRWRAAAREGDFEQAYALLSETGRAEVRDEPGDLLLAADVARLTRHPKEAVAPLRRVLEAFASDPRAPLAAFTLGRVLLEDLGDPRSAAEAFATTRRLDTSTPLAENALAREVEAWFRAGESERARRAAEDFERLFPNGSRGRLVRRYGGLE